LRWRARSSEFGGSRLRYIRDALRTSECLLAVGGILLLALSIAGLVRANIYQFIERRQFARSIAPEDGRAPAFRPTVGSAIGTIEIPRISLSAIVVEGDGDKQLELAAGHVPGTAFPGEPGNSGISGHRDTVFRALRLIRKNDEIAVTTHRGEFTYRVTSTQIVHPGAIHVLFPTKSEVLTLVTCYPFYFVGPAPQRFIVRAERVADRPEK
jgi:LPXTG-site transpeptidase (sortase) family protein